MMPTFPADALCRTADVDLFYPEVGPNACHAVKICKACPVMYQCLAHALARSEKYGIWGGLSEQQRERLRRGRAA